jgi:plasmid replication initiation protein
MNKDILRQQGQYIAKANDIIQRSYYSLSAQQQRVLLYMISKVKPNDASGTKYQISIREFCEVCGIEGDSGKHYKAIKETLLALYSASMMLKVPDSTRLKCVRWLAEAEMDDVAQIKGGVIEYSFHPDIAPYLFNLRRCYTQYRVEFVMPLRSKYAIRLYELLKSLENMKQELIFDIDELKRRLDAENYARFPDFRRYVIEAALCDINTYTDIAVKYTAKKTGKAYTQISFSVWGTFGAETERRREARFKKLGIDL